MAKELKSNNTSSNDEIDLGQLFQMIGNGFNQNFQRATFRISIF